MREWIVTKFNTVSIALYRRFLSSVLKGLRLDELARNLHDKVVALLSPSTLELSMDEMSIHVHLERAEFTIKHIMNEFEKEKHVLGDLLTEIERDDVFYDIGGNVGIYSCFAGQVIDSGSIFTFEPHPEIIEMLRINLEYNDVDTTIVQAAVSSSSGTIQLEPRGYSGHHTVKSVSAGSIPVDTISLDEFSKANSNPSVIKVDVEGSELEVLNGMETVLSNDRCRLIYCEVHPESSMEHGLSSAGVRELERTLERHGYVVEMFESQRGQYFLKASRSGPS